MQHNTPPPQDPSKPSSMLESLVDISRRAGVAVLEIYDRADHDVSYKDDRSPLTAADLASHRCILDGLSRMDAGHPVLSEEGKNMAFAERRDWTSFWLVDPLDGTKEFIKRNGEFTINIALVENGVPVAGVVHAPVIGRTYLAEGQQAWRLDTDGSRRRIEARGTGGDELAIVASRSHPSPELEAFLEHLPPHRLVNMGSSLKLCLVAEAAADFYPRLGPTMEWDTGAAHAVVRGAGGEVCDLSGSSLRYNKENLRNPYFLVLGKSQLPWRQALEKSGIGVDSGGA